jgi:iron complex outermembrane receptor protein
MYDRLAGSFPYESSLFRINALSLAAFGGAAVPLTSTLSLTSGLRVEWSRQRMHRRESIPAPLDFAVAAESSAVLPQLGIVYTPERNTTLSVTAGAGYKPGGFSAFTDLAALATFGPERTQGVEAALTHQGTDGRWSATVRAFCYDITGYQIERSFATGGIGNEYLDVNAARARSTGGELELRWNPFRALTIAADAGVTQARLRRFTDPFTGVNYAGNQAPAVPTGNASLSADVSGFHGWFAGAELDAVGRTYFTEDEDLAFGQRAYVLLNARIGFTRGRYRFSIYARNLTRTDYYASVTPGVGHATPGDPPTWGFELRTHF